MENEKLFILPKIVSIMDRIIVKGDTLSDPRKLTIGLVTGNGTPDYSNIACQLDINFNGKIVIQCVEKENITIINDEFAASNMFTVSKLMEFEIKFQVRLSADGTFRIFVDVYVGPSILVPVELKHDLKDIRFLTVYGDVNKVSGLDFNFG